MSRIARTRKQSTPGAKPYGDHVWYTIEYLKAGKWVDTELEDNSMDWIKKHLPNYDYEEYGPVAIIRHRATAEIVTVKMP